MSFRDPKQDLQFFFAVSSASLDHLSSSGQHGLATITGYWSTDQSCLVASYGTVEFGTFPRQHGQPFLPRIRECEKTVGKQGRPLPQRNQEEI